MASRAAATLMEQSLDDVIQGHLIHKANWPTLEEHNDEVDNNKEIMTVVMTNL